MQTPPAHHTQFDIAYAIAIHRVAYGRDPRRVEIGLMEMRRLDDAGADRGPDRPLVINGVPVVVGSLEDRVKAIPYPRSRATRR